MKIEIINNGYVDPATLVPKELQAEHYRFIGWVRKRASVAGGIPAEELRQALLKSAFKFSSEAWSVPIFNRIMSRLQESGYVTWNGGNYFPEYWRCN